ncbi:MAG: M48 family metalloprotease [Candidatus Kapabacteria bacterium]|nr:M48 family metalloprotease [Candidatus Kapabacteria bacterium]MDW7996671.1 M48 family metalloprotease [Bacteroidota bacterium]MDW8225527.1 M48 family metalloprotease [Bacteroidota bacterium]
MLAPLAIVLTLSLSGCVDINVFPPSEDARLGAELDREIRANPHEYPILHNENARQYVQGIVDRILASPEVQYRGKFAYRVTLLHDDQTINAFCTPGGYIYVYTGLLRFVENEATLAAVLAHEIAHAEQRHATERMTKALGVQLLMDIVLGNRPDRATELAANLFAGLALLANSRSDEAEADDLSFRYLRTTPWYPGALTFFFEKLAQQRQVRLAALERLLSTHPLPEDRVEAMQKRVQTAQLPPPTEQNLRARPYQDFLRLLP